jgi:tetratricopeptide (TPR) repeat protein
MVRLIAPARATLLAAFLFGCATTPKPEHLPLGNQYAKDGLLREAAEEYKKAIAEKPQLAAAHRNLGMVLVKLGDYKAASRHLEQAIGKYEKDFDANYYLGESYRAQDKYAEAIFRYKKALKLKDGDVRAMKPLAWSYFKIRYYSEALVTARELQKAAPEDDQVGVILARTCSSSSARRKRSPRCARRARRSRRRRGRSTPASKATSSTSSTTSTAPARPTATRSRTSRCSRARSSVSASACCTRTRRSRRSATSSAPSASARG